MGLTDENGKMYHIALSKDELEGARYAIMCGDPARVSEKLRLFLQDSKTACVQQRI